MQKTLGIELVRREAVTTNSFADKTQLCVLSKNEKRENNSQYQCVLPDKNIAVIIQSIAIPP